MGTLITWTLIALGVGTVVFFVSLARSRRVSTGDHDDARERTFLNCLAELRRLRKALWGTLDEDCDVFEDADQQVFHHIPYESHQSNWIKHLREDIHIMKSARGPDRQFAVLQAEQARILRPWVRGGKFDRYNLISSLESEWKRFADSSPQEKKHLIAQKKEQVRSLPNEKLLEFEMSSVVQGKNCEWPPHALPFLPGYVEYKKRSPDVMRMLEEQRQHAERDRKKALEEARQREQQRIAHAQAEARRIAAEREAERQARLAYERAYKVRLCGSCGFYPFSLIPKCPFCESSREQQEIAAADRAAPIPQSVAITPVKDGAALRPLLRGLNSRLEAQDFIGIANSMLEVLMRKGQEENPDDQAKIHYQLAPRIVARFFHIPEILTYAQPHRDLHLPHHMRHDWLAYAFPQLVVFAYLLGATWKTLPPPHDRLLPYYLLMAGKQANCIQEAKETYEKRPKPDPVNRKLSEIDAVLRNDDADAESKLRAIAARTGRNNGQPPAARAHNPEDL